MSCGVRRSVPDDRLELAVQADERVGGNLEVEVGALGRDQVAEGVVEIEGHRDLHRPGPEALEFDPDAGAGLAGPRQHERDGRGVLDRDADRLVQRDLLG